MQSTDFAAECPKCHARFFNVHSITSQHGAVGGPAVGVCTDCGEYLKALEHASARSELVLLSTVELVKLAPKAQAHLRAVRVAVRGKLG